MVRIAPRLGLCAPTSRPRSHNASETEPWIVTAIGGVGLMIILWLMMFNVYA